VTDPAVTDPSVTDPAVTDPSVTDPAVTDPAVTGPATTEPVTAPPTDNPQGPVLITSIELKPNKSTLAPGEEVAVSYTIYPLLADQGFTWEVSGGTLIDEVGRFRAGNAEGTLVITAKAKDTSGVTTTIRIPIQKAKVSSITISGGTSVSVGSTLQLSATVRPDNAENKKVTWSIASGASYASIDASGKLTASAVGTVTVKVTADDGSGTSATYTVKVTPIKVTSITISGGTSVSAGSTLQLSATVKPDNAENKKVTWSIASGSSYASVSADGLITAKAPGSVKIKATAADGSGVSATYTVTVKEAALLEGAGTKANPFLIRNLDDLKSLPKFLDKSGYYFRQTADIDCASVGEWIVIGTENQPFRHHYDGDGYKISNLCLDGDAIALFSYATDASFTDIKIKNANTSYNAYPDSSDSTILRSHDEGDTAALVGLAIGCTFRGCSADIRFESRNSNTAGLIVRAVLKKGQGDLAVDCHVSGTMGLGGAGGGLIGSIAQAYLGEGYAPNENPAIKVKRCTTDVTILCDIPDGSCPAIGGLIGAANLVSVENCSAKGDITAYSGYIGGLIGEIMYDCNVIACYATGNILANIDPNYIGNTPRVVPIYGSISLGGLIGQMRPIGTVHDCYATGNITAPKAVFSPCQDDRSMDGGPFSRYYNPCGSLIGSIITAGNYTDLHKISLYHCYATGTVNTPHISEDERVYCHGALVGLVLDNYTRRYMANKSQKDQSDWAGFTDTCILRFEDNYNLENLRTYYTPLNNYQGKTSSGMSRPYYDKMPQHEYVEIITKSQLTDQSTFEGWDFTSVWKMTANGPTLR